MWEPFLYTFMIVAPFLGLFKDVLFMKEVEYNSDLDSSVSGGEESPKKRFKVNDGAINISTVDKCIRDDGTPVMCYKIEYLEGAKHEDNPFVKSVPHILHLNFEYPVQDESEMFTGLGDDIIASVKNAGLDFGDRNIEYNASRKKARVSLKVNVGYIDCCGNNISTHESQYKKISDLISFITELYPFKEIYIVGCNTKYTDNIRFCTSIRDAKDYGVKIFHTTLDLCEKYVESIHVNETAEKNDTTTVPPPAASTDPDGSDVGQVHEIDASGTGTGTDAGPRATEDAGFGSYEVIHKDIFDEYLKVVEQLAQEDSNVLSVFSEELDN